MTTAIPSGQRYALEVPAGWEALELPGATIELEVQGPGFEGHRSVLSLERYEVDEQTPPEAAERLFSDRVEQLMATTVDAILIDLAEAAPPRGAAGPGLRATVAYRHGPVTATSLLWLHQTDDHAFLLTGVVDTDLLEQDGVVLEGIVGSLDLDAAEPVDLPPLLGDPAGQQPSAADLPRPPAGWLDADLGDAPALGRVLIAEGTAAPGVSVSTMLVPTELDDERAHEAAVLDLCETLTDATLLGAEPGTVAGALAWRSSLWFRSAQGERIAEVWTCGAVVAWSVTATDDEDGRASAATLIETASLAELGCAEVQG